MYVQQRIEITTHGRGMVEITDTVKRFVDSAAIQTGLCHIFIQHTSASLILCENADPDVQADLQAFAQRLIPDDNRLFRHTMEGPDDMPAHIRTVLTGSSLSIPVGTGRCLLGVWQGVFLWEHRYTGHNRGIVLTVHGE